MKMLSLDDAIKAVTMLMGNETDADMIWSCDVINNLQNAPSVTDVEPTQKWINIKDRLPVLYHMVLITGHNGFGGSFGVVKGSYDGNEAGWYRDDIGQYAEPRGDVVTYWMPLPEQPKEVTS